jgi:adenine-specific DNA-methyltransferase
VDYGVRVSTGPLVWNRHKAQLVAEPAPGALPLLWAEAVPAAGFFQFKADRRNHQPFFLLGERQDHLVQREECVLIQRTTAKEQERRLIAAMLPQAFIDRFGGAVIENHLNVIRPVGQAALVPLRAIAALLNAAITDELYRCTSGSVAVSAYELESLPVPTVDEMLELARLLEQGAGGDDVEDFLRSTYNQMI